MASLRTALRAAPRAHLLRPTTTTTSRIAQLAQRSYARPAVPQPATDEKSAGEAEQAQEDLTMDNTDPNMVCNNSGYVTTHLGTRLTLYLEHRTATTPTPTSPPPSPSNANSATPTATGGIPSNDGTTARRCMKTMISSGSFRRRSIRTFLLRGAGCLWYVTTRIYPRRVFVCTDRFRDAL